MKRDIFSQEHDLFRTAFKSFVEREVVPHQAAWREDGLFALAQMQQAAHQRDEVGHFQDLRFLRLRQLWMR